MVWNTFTVGRRVLVVSSGSGREERSLSAAVIVGRKGKKGGRRRGSDVGCNGSQNDFDVKNAGSRGIKTKKITINKK